MEREAMRRLRQRKRFPTSKGHDTFEDQVVSGTRHKVLRTTPSPERLAKGSLRRRSRTPSPRASN